MHSKMGPLTMHRPWAVIVDGSGAVSERQLVDQKPGTLLKTTVEVVSSSVKDGVRTVVMTRALKGAGKDTTTCRGPAALCLCLFKNTCIKHCFIICTSILVRLKQLNTFGLFGCSFN